MDLERIKEVGLRAAASAAEALVEIRSSGSLGIQTKSNANDLVTAADLEAEKRILELIKAEFPKHSILSEEGDEKSLTAEQLTGPLWIIDPVDGTTNYAHGMKECCVSIGFANEGKLQFGVVNAPFLGSIYHAVKGAGAFKNNKVISVSNCEELSKVLVATGFPYDKEEAKKLFPLCSKVYENVRGIRRLGSAAIDLCYVAEGVFDAYYESVNPWDVAAGALILREAGGKLGYFKTSDENPYKEYEFNSKFVLATSPKVFESMQVLLQNTFKDLN